MRMTSIILSIAGKAVIAYQGKVLIVREATGYKTGTQHGNYDVVGGRIKPGEHLEIGLRREAREECGLDITIGEPFFVNESWPTIQGQSNQIIRVFFRCTASSDAVTLSPDHDQYLWIDPSEYKNYQVIDNLHAMFDAYLSGSTSPNLPLPRGGNGSKRSNLQATS